MVVEVVVEVVVGDEVELEEREELEGHELGLAPGQRSRKG